MEMFVLLDSLNGAGPNAIVGVTFDLAVALKHNEKRGCGYKKTILVEG